MEPQKNRQFNSPLLPALEVRERKLPLSRVRKYLSIVFVFVLVVLCIQFYNAKQPKVVVKGSDAWNRLEAAGMIKNIEVSETELYSNGYVLKVVGLASNPYNSELITKVSADLINKGGKVYHKCSGFSEPIPAKSETQFKFHCANIKDIDYKNHASAKIYTDF